MNKEYNMYCIFFFKQKTSYEMRISDWSSDVCSSDLRNLLAAEVSAFLILYVLNHGVGPGPVGGRQREDVWEDTTVRGIRATVARGDDRRFIGGCAVQQGGGDTGGRRFPPRPLGPAGRSGERRGGIEFVR